MSMFDKDDAAPPTTADTFQMPPMATITVTLPVVVDEKNGRRIYETETWEGHQIEQTTFGALNIHRLFRVSEEKVFQKMVVSYAPGEWKRVTQTLDVIEFTPTRLLH